VASVATDSLITVSGRLDAGIKGAVAAAILILFYFIRIYICV